jgi:hypothetical protein
MSRKSAPPAPAAPRTIAPVPTSSPAATAPAATAAAPAAPQTICITCGSARREPYRLHSVQEYASIDRAGKPYTHIVRNFTRCLDCGQNRIDRILENRPRASVQ